MDMEVQHAACQIQCNLTHLAGKAKWSPKCRKGTPQGAHGPNLGRVNLQLRGQRLLSPQIRERVGAPTALGAVGAQANTTSRIIGNVPRGAPPPRTPENCGAPTRRPPGGPRAGGAHFCLPEGLGAQPPVFGGRGRSPPQEHSQLIILTA